MKTLLALILTSSPLLLVAQTGDKVSVVTLGTFHFDYPNVVRLPETHENSNYILLRIPIEIHLFERGLQAICIDSHRLPEILGLSETSIEHLQQAGLVRAPPLTARAKERVD